MWMLTPGDVTDPSVRWHLLQLNPIDPIRPDLCSQEDPPVFNWLIWIRLLPPNHCQMIYQVDTGTEGTTWDEVMRQRWAIPWYAHMVSLLKGSRVGAIFQVVLIFPRTLLAMWTLVMFHKTHHCNLSEHLKKDLRVKKLNASEAAFAFWLRLQQR